MQVDNKQQESAKPGDETLRAYKSPRATPRLSNLPFGNIIEAKKVHRVLLPTN